MNISIFQYLEVLSTCPRRHIAKLTQVFYFWSLWPKVEIRKWRQSKSHIFFFLCEWNFAGQNMQTKTYLPYWGVDCRWRHVRIITSNQPIFALIAYLFGDFVFLLLIFNLLKVIFWVFKSQLINTFGEFFLSGPSTLVDQSFKTKIKKMGKQKRGDPLDSRWEKIIVIA